VLKDFSSSSLRKAGTEGKAIRPCASRDRDIAEALHQAGFKIDVAKCVIAETGPAGVWLASIASVCTWARRTSMCR